MRKCNCSLNLAKELDHESDERKVYEVIFCNTCGEIHSEIEVTSRYDRDPDSWLEDFYELQMKEKENKS